MPQAIWNGVVIAASDDTVVVEGNHYFPVASVNRDYLVDSDKHTVCPWKGTASYFTLEVDGKRNEDAAWYYPTPSSAAQKIKGRIAFWRGVEVVDRGDDSGRTGLMSFLTGRRRPDRLRSPDALERSGG
jgi:uncharacterized protein (DUF427 family)